MMRLFLKVLGAFIMAGLIAGGASAAQCEGSITEDEALKAEDARYAAQTGNDFAAMARIFADDLVYVHSSGVVDGKESYIDRQRTHALRYRAMRRSDAKVRVYGCVAIITGAGNFDVTVNGKDSAVSLLFHSIWAKTDSGVQFVSWESTSAPAKP
jgi:ketosteroid isomerase-like protein